MQKSQVRIFSMMSSKKPTAAKSIPDHTKSIREGSKTKRKFILSESEIAGTKRLPKKQRNLFPCFFPDHFISNRLKLLPLLGFRPSLRKIVRERGPTSSATFPS